MMTIVLYPITNGIESPRVSDPNGVKLLMRRTTCSHGGRFSFVVPKNFFRTSTWMQYQALSLSCRSQ